MARLYVLLKQTLDDCIVCTREKQDNVDIIEAGGDETQRIHVEVRGVKHRLLDMSDEGDVILLVHKMNTLLEHAGVELTALKGREKVRKK